ncbi:MAG: hypothetical protein ABIR62_08705 [Dokdonella sp.]|uniref:hypothetical protein n=1 Tax=Dokdonella sp. TaxID=2291710 RepID=UPI003266D841
MIVRLAWLILVVLLSLLPLVGAAQTLPTLAARTPVGSTPLVEQLLALDASGRPMRSQGSPVLPIWSGSNGQLLAVVALPKGWTESPIGPTPAYAGPSAWHLAGKSAAAAGGLRWEMGDGFHADALLGEYVLGGTAPCAVPGGCNASTNAWSRGSLAGSLGLGWISAEGGLDVSYGLSWLQSQNDGATLGRLSNGSAFVPVLTLPDAMGYAIDGETSVYARGRWQFQSGSALDVGASFGRGHLTQVGALPNALAPGIDLDQLSLSLGLDVGSLRGAVVGHVLSSDDPLLAGKKWTSLDLGVSWRTPWSGELSVGAQNLWSAPASSPRDAENQARTPYIQYRQDL